ncbi:M48 family metallopeptidase [Quisquiliibacterium transsilvanicum]|uniref:STE24 endopeptidase n=1 Tax=Quisquiliibacterium transsilvanicum TaxID=1549638 RepID=A0A7W8HJM2_9BURK|nr:M48 family metallopeptidase [Quisquiliibacterium transsilvanicum]MBB5272370.1 STE24 endopeptidase [Quisquiliibacterium transsilvanicum]
MTPLSFSTLFVAALAVSLALRYWLAGRQVRHVARHRGAVPEAFAQRVPLHAHQRAADYTVARVRLGLLEAAFGSAVLVGFTLLGGLQWLQNAWLALLPDAPLLRQVLLVGSVVLVGGLFDLPMDWYRQFRLEQRFGFNRMSLRLWTADLLRGAAIGAALGLPLAAAALWLMRSAGQSWWLWVWALWIAFSLLVMWLYPSVIAPLFNRFEPLPPGPVRTRVEALLTRCGFAPRGLFVMDGSRRSAHGNAYFTGFGRARRIVFFDTLLSRLDEDEIEAVLAHELGHFRLKHIRKRILLGMATSLAGLWLLGLLARQPWFYQGLGVGAPVDFEALALLLFFLALPVFAFPLQPLFSLLSRRHEFEADAFAARNARATALASALVKLYEDNAATLTPDPLHSAFHDSHPPAAQRIGRLLAA